MTWERTGLTAVPQLCGLALADGLAIFVATRDGIYRSEDDGLTWSLSGLAGHNVLDVEAHGAGRLWAIVERGSIYRHTLYRSNDGGSTWGEVTTGDVIAGHGNGVGAFPTLSIGPEGVLFISGGYGLFRSADDGASWTRATHDTFPGLSPTTDVVAAPDGVLYIGAAYSVGMGLGERGVFRSLDGGLTWSTLHLFVDNVYSVAVAADGTLFAGPRGQGLFRSSDGENWKPAGLNTLRRSVRSILLGTDGAPMFLGTSKGVYRSAGDTEWQAANEGFADTLFVYRMATIEDQVFAGANGDVYRYDRTADRWVLPSNDGLATTQYTYELKQYGNALLVSTDYGLFRSDDTGTTWAQLPVPEDRISAFTSTADGTLVVGTSTSTSLIQFGNLYFSYDGGATWTVSAGWAAGPNGIPYSVAETPSGALLVGAVAGKVTFDIYRSDDGGASWTVRLNDIADGIVVTPSQTSVAAGEGGHYRSVDDGLTWEMTEIAGGYELEVTPEGGLASLRYNGAGSDVYTSTDDGLTWTQASASLGGYALTSDSESLLYLGTVEQGVFRSSEPVLVSGENDIDIGSAFALAPAFPNPLATSARLPFSLPVAGPVTLTVHDVLGRRVATLVDAVLPSGEHTATWNSDGAASGVYVVTLRAESQVVTRRITVAR